MAIRGTCLHLLACLWLLALAQVATAAPVPLPAPDLSRYSFTDSGGSVAASSVKLVGQDGQGRMFFAGPFTAVDGVALPGIMRIAADGTLDTQWVPVKPDKLVSIAQADPAGRVLLVMHVAGTGYEIWRYDGVTGGSGTQLMPAGSPILAVATDPDSNVYAAGYTPAPVFSQPSDAKILKFLGTTGAQDTSFDLTVRGSVMPCQFFVTISHVYALEHDGGSTLYVAGDFNSAKSGTTAVLVTGAFRASAQTGAVDPDWKPLGTNGGSTSAAASPPDLKLTCFAVPTSVAYSIAVGEDDFVYIGGYFAVGSRVGIGRYSRAAPGTADPYWAPQIAIPHGSQDPTSVSSLAIDLGRHRVYAMGTFEMVQGSPRKGLVALSTLAGSGVDPAWDPSPDMQAIASPELSAGNGRVLLGASFAGSDPRISAAAFPAAGIPVLRNYYQTILGREPDPSSSFWLKEVNRLSTLTVDGREGYIGMAMYFFGSPEFLATPLTDSQFVDRLYLAFLDRAADAGGRNFWVGQITGGLPRDMVMFAFMFSPEFNAYMAAALVANPSRTEVGVVTDFYRGALSRLPDAEGLRHWVNRFRTAQCRPAAEVTGAVYAVAIEIAGAFFGSPEYWAVQPTNRDYVSDLYNAFLRRSGDIQGFQYWVNILESQAQSSGQVRRAFIDSPEFGARIDAIVDAGCTTPL